MFHGERADDRGGDCEMADDEYNCHLDEGHQRKSKNVAAVLDIASPVIYTKYNLKLSISFV